MLQAESPIAESRYLVSAQAAAQVHGKRSDHAVMQIIAGGKPTAECAVPCAEAPAAPALRKVYGNRC